MKKRFMCVLACGLLWFLAGCQAATPRQTAQQPTPTVSLEPTVPPTPRPAPSEEEVLETRERVLKGMTEEEIQSLTELVVQSNQWWEFKYLYDNIFGQLSDPQDLTWNYFHDTGEIQIGWAYDGSLDMEAICAQEGLTEREFYEKYGTGVVTDNECDADGFIALVEQAAAPVQDPDLKRDLQYIMEETRLAKETHEMEHANNLYKALHDMDYFLLRDWRIDLAPYVQDRSTISKFYDMLSVYHTADAS